ncbi:uncharacterized protein [Cherax quadricarinatus]|uniref:uncharacterized protein isoform X2 n=1 Tax=Cherax quadricarinatus TaxID=27406 RepID=UPI00387E98AB
MQSLTTCYFPQSGRQQQESGHQLCGFILMSTTTQARSITFSDMLDPAGSKEPQSTVNGETVILMPSLPVGKPSQESYLLAPNNFECSNCALPRFLFGKKPGGHHTPAVYATIHTCGPPTLGRESRSTSATDNEYSSVNNGETETTFSLNLSHQNLSNGRRSVELRDTKPQPPTSTLTSPTLKVKVESKDPLVHFSSTTENTVLAQPFLSLLDSGHSSPPLLIKDDTNFNNVRNDQLHWRDPLKSLNSYNTNLNKDNEISIIAANVSFSSNDVITAHTANFDSKTSQFFKQSPTVTYNGSSNYPITSHYETSATYKPILQYNNIVDTRNNERVLSQEPNNKDDTVQTTVQDEEMMANTTASYHTSEKRHTSKVMTSEIILSHEQQFTVTYWMFYPYNYGKKVCTANLGFIFGRVFKPRINGVCHGEELTMGSHTGDWEHISIKFKGSSPVQMYISTHTFGAYYTYDPHHRIFLYASQDVREGIQMSPEYPQTIYLAGFHPILYAAKGSHGLWGASGIHRYMAIPLLEDDTGMGLEWKTWLNLDIIDLDVPATLKPHRHWWFYEGRWGNPSIKCHILMAGFCEHVNGPTGIIRKRVNFPCNRTNNRNS